MKQSMSEEQQFLQWAEEQMAIEDARRREVTRYDVVAKLRTDLHDVEIWIEEYFMEPGSVHEAVYDERFQTAVDRQQLLRKAIHKCERRWNLT